MELFVKEADRYRPAEDSEVASAAARIWAVKAAKNRPDSRVLSEARRKKLVEDRRQGMTYSALVRRYKVSKGLVYKILRARAPELLVSRA